MDNTQGIADSLSHLGLLAIYEQDVEIARTLHEESLALWRSTGDQFGIGWALSNLGAVAVLEGDLIEARALLAESARVNADLHSAWAVACSLEGFALLAAAHGQPARALRLAGAATALRASAGTPLAAAGKLHMSRQLAASRGALGNDRAAHVYAEGQQLPLEKAVEYALLEDARAHLPTQDRRRGCVGGRADRTRMGDCPVGGPRADEPRDRGAVDRRQTHR